MAGQRALIVTADDFGIGPAITRGILDLAQRGAVSATVLLVNSPHAAQAVRDWQRAGRVPELGWHACLTLDRPVLSAGRVPSLIDERGNFWRLPVFLRKLLLGRICLREAAAELRAQLDRFQEMVGHAPTLANGHHHLHALPFIGAIVRRVLSEQRPLPYLRRVREPWATLVRVGGTRCKRLFLATVGDRAAQRQSELGFPGSDWLAGLGGLRPDSLTRWLDAMPGRTVELVCHPGYVDETLLGRDATSRVELSRRHLELQYLLNDRVERSCTRAGLAVTAPCQLNRPMRESELHAA